MFNILKVRTPVQLSHVISYV